MSILSVPSTSHVLHRSAEINLASDLSGLEGHDFGLSSKTGHSVRLDTGDKPKKIEHSQAFISATILS